MQKKGSVQSKRTAEEMRFLLEQQAASGQNVKQFCKEFQLSAAVFYYWQKKLRQSELSKHTSGGFGEMLFHSPEAGQLFAEYRGIRFYQEPSASFLRQLIG